MSGLNPDLAYKRINKELTMLDNSISFSTSQHTNYFPLYGTVKQALEEGFTHPKSIYQGILKQPSTDLRPLIVGETETEYYNSILQRRLNNVPNELSKTGAKIAKRVLKEIIGKGITLYFIPPDRYDKENELTTKIPSCHLDSIKIPSRYTLLTICARNKGLQDGTKITITSGESYHRKKTVSRQYSSLTYYNYELVEINDKFEYDNDELTGDLSYDLDDLYGGKDAHNSREMIKKTNLDERLRRIKNSYDINLSYRDGKYTIGNGRHRILFLKHYYQNNMPYCTSPYQKESIKNQTSVIAYVDRTIEDEDINKYLIFFEQNFRNVRYYKTNITNDKFDIIVTCGNYAYHISNKQELIKFIKLMRQEKFKNEYFIGLNSNYEIIPYQVIIAQLTIVFGKKILQMDLIDIINYLNNNQLIINDQAIELSGINYDRLNIMFTSLIHFEQLGKLRGIKEDIEKEANKTLDEFCQRQKKL